MKVHRTIRYRVHPGTQAKARKLAGLAGACRFVWNHFVGKLRDEYLAYGRCKPWYYTLGKQFTLLRRHCEPWLQEYSANIVKSSLKPIEIAYKKFYDKKGGLPRFHARYVHHESFPLVSGLFRIRGRHLHIAKIGEFLLLGHNPYPDAKPVSGTVKRECGNWYAYVVYAVEQKEIKREYYSVGIDRNVGQITCSDGIVYRGPDTTLLEARRRRYQRMMARRKCGSRKHKVKPSNRYLRAKHSHAITCRKIRQKRVNWCHHVSKEVSERYSVVHLEDLNTKGMTRSAKGTAVVPGRNVKAKSGLNKGILKTDWYKMEQYLGYKTQVNYVPAQYTSITCNKCKCKNKKNRVSQSLFVCVDCGHRDNADWNAALNIKKRGEVVMSLKASGNGAAGRGDGGKTLKELLSDRARSVKRQMDTIAYNRI